MSLKINIKQFKKWIAALDSGEYRQGQCALQTDIGYCCLGVACIVTIPKELTAIDVCNQLKGGMPSDQPAAPRWLVEINKDFRDKTSRDLMALNDTYGFTFSEIATLLELVYIHKILD
jgi:hypothetical protein